MIPVGLTGSIGMGKSTTAALFAEEGVAVWDADAAVHRLYATGGEGVLAVAAIAPNAVTGGAVDRALLRQVVLRDTSAMRALEAAIHPLVAADRARFLAAASAEIALCDVPLLFETGLQAEFDAVVVVSAPAATQRARVLARPGMTEEAFAAILAKQTPDAEKRAKADFVIDTGAGLEAARAQVAAVVRALRDRQGEER